MSSQIQAQLSMSSQIQAQLSMSTQIQAQLLMSTQIQAQLLMSKQTQDLILAMSNPNRLSSTIDSNRKINQLRTTSYVSNGKRKTTCPLISWYYFQDSEEINVVFVGLRKKYLQLKIR